MKRNLKCISMLIFIITIFVLLNGCNSNIDDKKSTKKAQKSSNMCHMFFGIEKPYTDEDIQNTITIFQTRLDSIGITERIVTKKNNGTIKVTVPKESFNDDIISYLTKKVNIKFTDYEENIIITGDNIKSAKSIVEADETGKNAQLVELELTDDGRMLFKEATAKIATYPSDQNVIMIFLDDVPISAPRVNTEIDSTSVVISGDFNKETAKTLVDQINSGSLKNEINHIRTEK